MPSKDLAAGRQVGPLGRPAGELYFHYRSGIRIVQYPRGKDPLTGITG